jgi:chromosome segregation ATPase
MAEDGANNGQQTIQAKIRINEERIKYKEQGLKKSFKSNDERFKDLEDRNDALETEIKELRSENKFLAKQLQEMKDDNVSIKKAIEFLTKDYERRIANEESKENVLRITQIGTSIERNICQYVLGQHFNKNYFYKVKELETCIERIKDTEERNEATSRWSRELEVQIGWDQGLVDTLRNLKDIRIGIAHPQLTETIIQDASDCLEKDGTLDKGMVNNINKLKEMWKKSEYLLG